MSQKFILDIKAAAGFMVGLLGFVVANGSTILPLVPSNYQHTAGAVIGISGLVVTFLSNPPVPHTPTPPAVSQGPKGI